MNKIDHQKIKDVKFNPLVDYNYETLQNIVKVPRNIDNTSLTSVPFIKEETDDGVFMSYEDRDNRKYTKVVNLAGNRNKILGFKPSTLKLFLWILFHVDYRSDVVRITPEALSSHLSPTTFNVAIAELQLNRIISRIGAKREEAYWDFNINPQYLFVGDAKKFYNDVISIHPTYASRSKVKIEIKTRKKRN